MTAPAVPVAAMEKAAQDVLAERERQKSKERWTIAHDDEHDDGSLAQVAACYAATQQDYTDAGFVSDAADDTPYRIPVYWPRSWDFRWWKPKDRRRNLVRAAALIIAEIERLDRLAAQERQS